MALKTLSLSLAIGASLLPLNADASSTEPKTAAAVLAADEAWGAAEARGDADFVDWLLWPGYVSVGAAGKVTPKSTIVAGARARHSSASAAAKMADADAAWRAAHPVRGEVSLHGSTAVLTWILVKPGSGEPVSSSDIFVYRGGHWHAIYSQHTSASA